MQLFNNTKHGTEMAYMYNALLRLNVLDYTVCQIDVLKYIRPNTCIKTHHAK